MSSPVAILRALQDGPKTNAQLQDYTGYPGGEIARTASKLRHDGRVIRVNPGARKAIYALATTKDGGSR